MYKFVTICKQKAGLGLRKSTVFYMDLPVLLRLNCGAGTGTLDTANNYILCLSVAWSCAAGYLSL